MRRRFFLLLISLVFLGICPQTIAASKPLYGPSNITIGPWHVHFSLHSFPCPEPAQGFLSVSKAAEAPAPKWGWVMLNGHFYSINAFLQGDKPQLTIQVNLMGKNLLAILLVGPPGSQLTFKVEQEIPSTPPQVAFSAKPSSIVIGQSSTLTWQTENADKVTIDQGIGQVDPSGSLSVTPQQTTTYTITASGPGGTTTKAATVTVTVPAPKIQMSLSRELIEPGCSALLSWSTQYADTCEIHPDLGPVNTSGSIELSPQSTTTYTLTAQGPGGTSTCSLKLVVFEPPGEVDYGLPADEQFGGAGLISKGLRLTSGNVIDSRVDVELPSPNRLGLRFAAYYNSKDKTDKGMGTGWSHSYTPCLAIIDVQGKEVIQIVDETGRGHYFLPTGTNKFEGLFGESSTLELRSQEYVWHRKNDSCLGFAPNGALSWIADAVGNKLIIEHDQAGRVEKVNDTASGRCLTLEYNDSGRLARVIGPVTPSIPDGVWVKYQYDNNGNLVDVQYADGSGFQYKYEDPGDINNLTQKIDQAGHLLARWSYDSQDRVIHADFPNANTVSIKYVSEDQVQVTDAYSVVRTYSLTSIKGIKRVIYVEGPSPAPYTKFRATGWQYDSMLRLTEVEVAGGLLIQFSDHNSRGNPGKVILAAGTDQQRIIHFTYHPLLNRWLSRIEKSVLGDGYKVTVLDYDDDDNEEPNQDPSALLHRVIERGFTMDNSGSVVPYEYVTTLRYNEKGQLIFIDGPRPGQEDAVRLSYDDGTGNVQSMVLPLVGTVRFSDYDGAGRVGRVTDINGVSRLFQYDPRGRLVGLTYEADGSGVEFTYDKAGLLATALDADSVIRTLEYDPDCGRLFKITDAQSNSILYSYNSQGNITQMSYQDPGGHQTFSQAYDYQGSEPPGLLHQIRFPDGTYVEFAYDEAGRRTKVQDRSGNTTQFEYDVLGRTTAIVRPGDAQTRFGYDLHGNLVSVTDAEGRNTAYLYDDLGRLVYRSSPDTGITIWTYDAAGNVTSKKDAKGNLTQYEYDQLDRLVAVHFPDPNYDYRFVYDEGPNAKGRLCEVIDPTGSTRFSYDFKGRIIGKTSIIDGVSFDLKRSYTAQGRLSSITYPTGKKLLYEYDNCGRLDSIMVKNGDQETLLMHMVHHLPFGPADKIETFAGNLVESGYDEQYRLTASNPGQQTERLYHYTPNGLLEQLIVTNLPQMNQSYAYDALNRLVSASGPYGTINYAYDKTGNRLSRELNGEIENYSYQPGSSRLVEITGPNPTDFSYDENGNVVSAGNLTFTYDFNNRLVKADNGDRTIAQYTYNALGQKATKQSEKGKIIFIYDLNGNLIAEAKGDGSITSEYFYTGKTVLARSDAGVDHLYYYVKNQVGAPVLITDPDGAVLWQAQYLPFGQAQVNSHSSIVNNLRFPGQYFDNETGLHYNYFRHYHPGIGRFIEPDPIGLRGGINLYAYAFNDPVNIVDPTGQFGLAGIIIGATSGALGGLAAGLKSGNIWAGIIGGIAGGIVGGAIGFAFPPASGMVATMIGNAVAGAIGGATAGMVGTRLRNPGATNKEILLGTAKGAGIGLLTGSISGAAGGAVAQLGASPAVGELAGTMIAQPIDIGLGLAEFNINWNPNGEEEAIPDVWPEAIAYPDDWGSALEWDPQNPQEIKRETSVTLTVSGGSPPYDWAVTGQGFTLDKRVTQGGQNVLKADSTACGAAVVSVSDSAGNTVSGSLREPNHGRWVLVVNDSCADIDLQPGQCNCTRCSTVVVGANIYKDCWWGGTRPERYHGPYCEKWPYTEDLSDSCCYCAGYTACRGVQGLYTHQMWKWECK